MEQSSLWAKFAGVVTPALAVLLASRRKKVRKAAVVSCATATKTAFNVDDIKDVCSQSGITLARYMIELQKQGVVDTELGVIMNSIREATKVIACLIRRAPLQQADLLGLQGEVNVQGEDQKKLDVITNEVLKNALRYTGKLGTMASEEEDAPVQGGADLNDDLNDEFN